MGWVLALLLSSQLLGCGTAARKGGGIEPHGDGGARPIATVKIAAGVTVEIRSSTVPDGRGTRACWTYQTRGLADRQHAELALTLGREPNEAETSFPRDIVELLETFAAQVLEGHRFRAWDKVGSPDGLLGRKDLTGVLMVPALLPSGVPHDRPGLSLLLVTSDELEVAVAFGVPRLASMLGMQQRFFPTAIFVDRKRASLCSKKELSTSLPARAGYRQWLRGAKVWNEIRLEQATRVQKAGQLPDLKATMRGTVVFSLNRQMGTQVGRTLESAEPDSVVAFLMPPADDADARLVWVPGQTDSAIITDLQLSPKKLAGNYILLLNSEAMPRGGYMVEDGFTVAFPPADWQALRKAIATGLAYRLEATENNYGFEIRWTAGETTRSDSSIDELAPGIVYKTALKETNERAKRTLSAMLTKPRSAGRLATVWGHPTICGPFLWAQIKNQPGIQAAGMHSVFAIPGEQGGKTVIAQTLEGRTFQSEKDGSALAAALVQIFGADETFTVRKASNAEIALVWALVPTDITEPVFVAESARHSLLMMFDGNGEKIGWLEDFRDVEFVKGKIAKIR